MGVAWEASWNAADTPTTLLSGGGYKRGDDRPALHHLLVSAKSYPPHSQLTMPPKPSAKGAKKAAKTQKAARTGDKKRRHKRKESYSVYIYRVLKQVRFV